MKLLLLLPALLWSVFTFAQGVLEIKKPEIVLKNVKADDQPTTVTYTVKNIGTQPVIISRIVPMTGLLKATWDRAPLAPGKTADIKISFVSAQMQEQFTYGVMVYSNARNNMETLKLSANIVDNPEKMDLLYKYSLDGIKFKKNNVQLGNIYTWQVVSDTLSFINARQDTTRVGILRTPHYIQAAVLPTVVAPGEQGKLIITYNAPKKNDYGYIYESVYLSINHDQGYRHRISVTGKLAEDFSKLSRKELANAPVATFDRKEINFGTIKPGEKANCDFILTNTGKTDLIIRKTRASCGCTAVAMGQYTIAPGESTTIRATFDSTGKSGHQYKTVTVITNDPQNPEATLNITGDIK